MANEAYDQAHLAAKELAKEIGEGHSAALVLGSGWGEALAEIGEQESEVLAETLTGFAPPTVEGHGGKILSVQAGGKKVLVFQGRTHLYEGRTPLEATHGVRVAWAAGCKTLILTNAAGGINPDFQVGDPVLISDHINLTGNSPLTGPPPPEELGIRFLDMSDPYSSRLREIAQDIEPSLKEGVYAGFLGPQFETPSEIKMAQTLGADLAGMSTVLECIMGRYLKLEVMGVSLVTNAAAGVTGEELNHEEVLEIGKQSSKRVGTILRGVIDRLEG